ncbi:MAG: pyridoxal phosphate-dependent aminotransferase, partial [Planctomycetota bacterium]|nr:pyridoxal phosphate-dependent aminotransferase [Planctomycetota bacterium]
RRAMLDYYRRIGLEIGEDEMIITMGASEALQFAYLAICNAGDEIVVFEPLYSNIISYMAMCDVRPVPITLDPRNSFRLPPVSEIEKHITPRTKAIQICSPNNPTGTIISRGDLEGIAELCLRRNLFLISDEVYREFTYDGKSHVSAMDIAGIADRVVVADSISKRFSACGARIGAIISRNRELIAKALVCAQARLCPPMLEQAGAAACFRLPAGFYEPVVKEYQRRRDTLCRGLAAIPGVSSFVPAGAFYLMAALPVDSSEAFCKWLLTDFDYNGETVMFAPGPGFYVTPGLGTREIRIAYVLECPKIERAMAILRKALEVYPGRETV